ncbi:MAG: hypothetical protein LBV26_02325 [Bacteroidales bacterium]|jgi:hypothetical protein|nr:hypothetical protein [Bacteroidales bacterium]
MKAHILKLATILLLLTVVSHSCEKEAPDKLPPETQEGKNTFGCYINDILFARIKFRSKKPFAEYNRETNSLFFGCEWSGPSVVLYLENPREFEYNNVIFGNASHSETESSYHGCWYFVGENTGYVFLTKFDTINRIVSGTFEFSARCVDHFYGPHHVGNIEYAGDSTVQVSNGRFDIKLNVY